MANYKQSDVIGTRWTRCHNVNITNPLNSTPIITFFEEEVIDMGNENFHKNLDSPIIDSLNLNNQIELLDPSTGQSTGQSVSEGFLYVAIYSKYMAMAAKRDAINSIDPAQSLVAPEPEPEPIEEPVAPEPEIQPEPIAPPPIEEPIVLP